MAFDMSRCPQTEDEARTWFYAGIGQKLGAPATNWEAIMTNCGLPPGYGPGVVPNASMPYFAFTQQFSGAPKGRIFLPSNTPDENGYYTRCIQYLDDAVGTYSRAHNPQQDFRALPKSTQLVWAWYHVAGNQYDPVVGAEGGGTQPPTQSGLTKEEVQAMIDASLAAFAAVKLGDKIALRTNSGLLAGIQGGGPTKADAPINWIGKEGDAHSWESLTIEKGE